MPLLRDVQTDEDLQAQVYEGLPTIERRTEDELEEDYHQLDLEGLPPPGGPNEFKRKAGWLALKNAADRFRAIIDAHNPEH